MIVVPAIDLRDGKCVQLVGGAYDEERVRFDDPVSIAHGWAQMGFPRLHVVDLDAATGRGDNAAIVRAILRDVEAEVQVGGGVRTASDIERLLGEGAGRVVVGTRALEEPAWLEDVAGTFPGQLVVAADVRWRRVVTRGWALTHQRDVLGVIEDLNDLPLAAVLVTAVHREGRLAGPDRFLMEDVADASAHPVIASGGITTMADLRDLHERGLSAAVVGMALYTGALDGRAALEEFTD